MSDKDHKDLLELNLASKSKILLSGYDNQLYNDTLKGWDKVSFELPNNASLSKKKRRMIEYVWKNY